MFTNTVFGFLHAYVLLAVVERRGQVGGFIYRGESRYGAGDDRAAGR